MKIAIIGGGVSGFVAALELKEEDITIFEGNTEPLKKLSLTGNGRCNFLNEDMKMEHYHSTGDVHKLIHRDIKEEVLNFMAKLEIEPKIKNGYYYPFSNKASTIRNALIYEANKKNVNIRLNEKVYSLEKLGDKFIINKQYEFDKVIISSGLASYSYIGATTDGLKFAENMGHNIVKPLPSLVPLVSDDNYDWDGIRTDVKVSIFVDGVRMHDEVGEIQLTSYGISGICVFNLSRYASIALNEKRDVTVSINFLPNIEELYTYLNDKNNNVNILLKRVLNDKLVDIILNNIEITRNKPFKELSKDEQVILINELTNFKLSITGTKGIDQSQVSCGGVSLDSIKENFESKLVDNLFFTGEVIDIDGDCGGYNIAFAIYSAIQLARGIDNVENW